MFNERDNTNFKLFSGRSDKLYFIGGILLGYTLKAIIDTDTVQDTLDETKYFIDQRMKDL